MRDVAVFEIEFVRGDVFEPLRAEIHGERAGYFREDARAVKNAHVVIIFQTVVVYTSRLVAERVCVCVCSRALARERGLLLFAKERGKAAEHF